MDPLTKQDFESLTTGEAHSLVVSSQVRRMHCICACIAHILDR